MVGVSMSPPHGSMAAKPTSSQTMKSTLGAPSGAVGCKYGSQSGLESRISRLTTPLNGLVTVRSPLSDSTSLNDDSRIQNTKGWFCANANRNNTFKLLAILIHLPSCFVSLAKYAKFQYLHVKCTPITTKAHPLYVLFLHLPTIGKDMSLSCCLQWHRQIGFDYSNTSLQSFFMLTTIHPYSWASSNDFSEPAT